MAQTRTDDDSVTYWFLWKHPMARRRGLEFGVFEQTPRKWTRRLGPTGVVTRSSFLHKTTIANSHLPLSVPLHENTTQMWARPCGPRLWSVSNAPGANFRPLCVRLAVSEMLHSTPTTLSVQDTRITLDNTSNICRQ